MSERTPLTPGEQLRAEHPRCGFDLRTLEIIARTPPHHRTPFDPGYDAFGAAFVELAELTYPREVLELEDLDVCGMCSELVSVEDMVSGICKPCLRDHSYGNPNWWPDAD